MKIILQHEITIEIVEGSADKESLKITYSEPTKAQKIDHKKSLLQYQKLRKDIRKISSKSILLNKKLILLDKSEKLDESLKVIENLEFLHEKAQKLEDSLEELIGGDEESFSESMEKSKFDDLVSGDDKEKLRIYAEQKGYVSILNSLNSAKAELEKKPSGK